MKTRSWKARRRGAAMVEALVAIPFFIVIFACTMFVGSFYQEKLRTLRESRRCAWDHSLTGCSGGCAATTQNAGSGSQLQPPTGTGSGKTNGTPGSQIMSNDMHASSFTVKSSATASATIGGWTKPIESTTTVMCDEVPENGDAKGAFAYLWNNGASW